VAGLGYDIFIFGVFGVLALNLVEQNPSWLLPEVEGGGGVIAGDLLIGSPSVLGNGFVGDSFTYLLLSCALLELRLLSLTFSYFADIFGDWLNGRRLFVSACEIDVERFATAVFKQSKRCFSAVAPTHWPNLTESAFF
jgi:hypothetical protein